MSTMRTTVRIADDLLVQLRERASQENASLTRVLDETLRNGLRAEEGGRVGGRPIARRPSRSASPASISSKASPWPPPWRTRRSCGNWRSASETRRPQRPALRGQRGGDPPRDRAQRLGTVARRRGDRRPAVGGGARLSPTDHQPPRLPRPLRAEEALARVDAWLRIEGVRLVGEKPEHWEVLRGLLAESGCAGNLTTDAHLAALAISHGAVLVSCDSDFARFRGLRWESPLAARA